MGTVNASSVPETKSRTMPIRRSPRIAKPVSAATLVFCTAPPRSLVSPVGRALAGPGIGVRDAAAVSWSYSLCTLARLAAPRPDGFGFRGAWIGGEPLVVQRDLR